MTLVDKVVAVLEAVGLFVPEVAWIAKLLPAVWGLVEAVRTGDPGQEYAAQVELLRQARTHARAEMARETREAIAADAAPVFLNSPFGDEHPYDSEGK